MGSYKKEVEGKEKVALDSLGPNPSGFCQCGCGEKTNLAIQNNIALGHVKGKPLRYIQYHQCRKSPVQYIIDPDTECWEWQRSKSLDGYGKLVVEGVQVIAHRYFYEQHFGLIPDGLTIDHLCRNRACVNPEHLEAVTLRTNLLRGEGTAAVNARKTHCIRGHPFDEANTYIDKHGWRFCRKCLRKKNEARYL